MAQSFFVRFAIAAEHRGDLQARVAFTPRRQAPFRL
jgi:hypothetical protein